MRVPKKKHENPKPDEVIWQRSECDATTRQSREQMSIGSSWRWTELRRGIMAGDRLGELFVMGELFGVGVSHNNSVSTNFL
jgi:hypothetical protein